MNVKLSIPAVLRLQAEAGVSDKELAERSGLRPQAISLILKRGTCSVINAGRIARSLGVGFDQIIYGGEYRES